MCFKNLISENAHILNISEKIIKSTEPESIRAAEMRATEILDAKYEKANLKEITLSNKTLNKDQELKLFRLLKRHKTLFDGTLGNFNDGEIDITLKPGVTPFRVRPYPIPHAQKDLMRREVDRLVILGVLEGPLKDIPEWGAPCFPIPKKNNQIRFITDLRDLNARIKRNHFPLPKIQLFQTQPLNP